MVRSQQDRAAGFRATLDALARDPTVVGADWFQYYDEPTHGRDDGENYNMGLVDIHDRPYEEIPRASASLDAAALRVRPPRRRPDASGGVPPAPGEPMGEFKPMLALKRWDRERGFVRPASELPLADLYVCWSHTAAYFGLYALDPVEDVYYRDRRVPEIDRLEWAVRLDETGKEIRVRLGAEREPSTSDSAVRVAGLSAQGTRVRVVAALEIPAPLLGRERLKPGDPLKFSSILLTHCRAYRVEWRGIFTMVE